jgi:two-component system, NarL family, response regulator NreC
VTSTPATGNDHAPIAPPQLRIVVAEDHRVVRRGLQLVLDGEPDLSVVAQAGTVAEARGLVREHAPHVLVLDLNMPGGPSLEAIPALRTEAPHTQIVVLTMEDDPSLVRAARRAGALGYVLKEAADGDLVDAVRRAAGGQPYLSRGLAARLIAQYTDEHGWD